MTRGMTVAAIDEGHYFRLGPSSRQAYRSTALT
eukprot:CAMPEP_0175914698 /NCGR_PEP_ID=MMETSP0108-20121206/9927_1 /TAXON_ID=195067 ORGANISM="Goniomonas pacifica, Strain CCMP1869" /NCGR_SAMPLE_ID=MMETSP0108 /ASSEMBLY_ACC=CAM_ASM_000204 /LENGTH=32 /DNA_ID= /DNA_START= /DNA_END= /DNA_ORIENTATION=